ncbi:autolysin sensor kinase [Lachnospiraceae bacterium KM106-2]|nr:autolysin sensor kinase [Lachnospiraceae bacterium KM106-2]
MILSKIVEKYISKAKIRKQLIWVFIVAILIPTVIISLFLMFYVKNLLIRQHSELLESDVSRIKSIFVEVTTQVMNTSVEINQDSYLRNDLLDSRLSKSEFKKKWSTYEKLDKYESNNAFIDKISIFYDGASAVNYKQVHVVTDKVKKASWYRKAIHNVSPFWDTIETYDSHNNASWNLYLVRRIPLPDPKEHAVLAIRVSDNYFRNRILNTDYGVVVTNNLTNSVIFSSKRSLYAQKNPIPQKSITTFYQYTGFISLDKGNYLSSTSTLTLVNTNNMFYVTSVDYSAYKYIQKILLICGLILLIAILVPMPISGIYSSIFSSRINTLEEQMKKASAGDYNIIPTFNGDDELTELFKILQVMVEDIKEKESKMYEAKITEQKLINQQHIMEYKALASQINPHFLYNALETIRMKAFTTGDREVATAIKLLGKSMRYVLDNTGTNSTTLDKEINYIEVYIQIQKLRFGDRFNYQLNVEDNMNLNDYSILPLLLQPIVENAISHGLEQNIENGLLTVDIHSNPKDSLLLIDISDNGSGMDEETLANLRKQIMIPNKSKTTNIGLYNIYQRIKLCYGEQYGMHISSTMEEGTKVSLTLPLDNTFHI